MADINQTIPPQGTQPNTQQPTAQPAVKQPANTAPEVVKDLYPHSLDNELEFLSNITHNMLSRSNKQLLIAGDTGLGKTSYIKQLGNIFGLPVVVIEAPHITEEELINIPFIVRQPNGQVIKGVEQLKVVGDSGDTVQRTKYGIQLAKSHLVTVLEKLQQMPPPSPKTMKPHEAELVQAFMDTPEGQEAYPAIRRKFQRILFIDEFFRTKNEVIINILRNILNGYIGDDPIPAGTYVINASNMASHEQGTSSSLSKQTSHTTFDQPEFVKPTVKRWANIAISDVMGDIQLKKDVVDAIVSSLQDSDLDQRDVTSGIRSSPRRWTDILLYLNNSYPFDSADEASIAKTSILRQFSNNEGVASPLRPVVENIINQLILKSGIDNSTIRPVPKESWRDILAHNVMAQIMIGKYKKYVPVVQGPPGIGKTSEVSLAFEREPYNLRVIVVSCSGKDTEWVSGIPLADTSKEKIEVSFSKSPLASLIDGKVEEARKAYMESLQQEDPRTAKEKFQEWEKQPYKYLIFFDEINRVKDIAAFNALRRVILEKSFNDYDELPKGTVVVAAMNQTDKGTIPLTAHFRDAINIIDAETSWKSLVQYIESYVIPKKIETNDPKPNNDAVSLAWKIVKEFPDQFADRKRNDSSNYQFHINIGSGDDRIYVSPRDYEFLLEELVQGLHGKLLNLSPKIKSGQIGDDEINQELAKAAFNKFKAMFNNLFSKAGMQEPPGFMDRVYDYLSTRMNINLEKNTIRSGLNVIIDSALREQQPIKDNPAFYNYIESISSNPGQIAKDLGEYLDTLVSPFMSNNKLDLDAGADVLFGEAPGSIYDIFREFAEAIKADYGYEYLEFVKLAVDGTYGRVLELADEQNLDEIPEEVFAMNAKLKQLQN